MRTLATGIWTDCRQHGFTLLELLVVIAIMTILAGLVVLSVDISDPNRALRDRGERLVALINLAHHEVMLGAPPVGIAFTAEGYHFQRQQLMDNEALEWRDIPDDRTLRPRSLRDAGLELELQVEGRPIELEWAPEQPSPNIFLEQNGTLTPFELVLRDRDQPDRRVRVTGEMNGRLTLEQERG
ncbi:MAG: type II secretion system minor pseudopilin GspH [Thiohalophilus sp.]